MSGDALSNKIDEVIKVIAKEDAESKNQICTGWILVTEWADFAGERYVATHISDSISPWAATGMLYYSIENDIYESDLEEDD